MGVVIALAAMTLTILLLLWRVGSQSAELFRADCNLRSAKDSKDIYYKCYVELLSDVADKQKRIEELEKALADQVELAATVAKNRDYWKRGLHEANRRLNNFIKISDSMRSAVAETEKPY